MHTHLTLGAGGSTRVDLSSMDIEKLQSGMTPEQLDGWFTQLWDRICDMFTGGNRVETKQKVRQQVATLLNPKSTLYDQLNAFNELKTLATANDKSRFFLTTSANSGIEFRIGGLLQAGLNKNCSGFEHCNHAAYQLSSAPTSSKELVKAYEAGVEHTELTLTHIDEAREKLTQIPGDGANVQRKMQELKDAVTSALEFERVLCMTGPSLEASLMASGAHGTCDFSAYQMPAELLNRSAKHCITLYGKDSALIRSTCSLKLSEAALQKDEQRKQDIANCQASLVKAKTELVAISQRLTHLEAEIREAENELKQIIYKVLFTQKINLSSSQEKMAALEKERNRLLQLQQSLSKAIPLENLSATLKECLTKLTQLRSETNKELMSSSEQGAKTLLAGYSDFLAHLDMQPIETALTSITQRLSAGAITSYRQGKKLEAELKELKEAMRALTTSMKAAAQAPYKSYLEQKSATLKKISDLTEKKRSLTPEEKEQLLALQEQLRQIESSRPTQDHGQGASLLSRRFDPFATQHDWFTEVCIRLGDVEEHILKVQSLSSGIDDALKDRINAKNVNDELTAVNTRLEKTKTDLVQQRALVTKSEDKVNEINNEIRRLQQQKADLLDDRTQLEKRSSSLLQEIATVTAALLTCGYKTVDFTALTAILPTECRVLEAEFSGIQRT